MEGRSFLGRFGFVLASFIPALGRAGYSEARNKQLLACYFVILLVEKESDGDVGHHVIRSAETFLRATKKPALGLNAIIKP